MNEPSRVSSSSGHSASIKQGGSSHPPCMVLHPPPHFSYLEENLCHCFGPLNKSHISFLSHIGIQRILNYSMRKFDSTILSHFETVGIHHVVREKYAIAMLNLIPLFFNSIICPQKLTILIYVTL